MIYLTYPNLLHILFCGSATELHQVDPNTVKPAIITYTVQVLNINIYNICEYKPCLNKTYLSVYCKVFYNKCGSIFSRLITLFIRH